MGPPAQWPNKYRGLLVPNPKDISEWNRVLSLIDGAVEKHKLPSVSFIAESGPDPFKILVSTMISLRTKDEVTLPASLRLFKEASTPKEMINLSIDQIANLIFPAGFYKTKADNIKKTCIRLVEVHGGEVPSSRDELMALPGVGTKTASLTLSLGFGIDAICVDTHVHRIVNRLDWIRTDSPEKSEKALEQILPREHWIGINELLIHFGQQICKPQSPHCSRCPLDSECPRIGVVRRR